MSHHRHHTSHRRSRRLAVAIHSVLLGLPSLAVPGIALTLSASGQAAESRAAEREYRIPAGELSGALSRFAAEAGVLLSVDAQLTDGRTSAGLNGRYSVDGGFAALLQGSGLEAALQANGSYTLRQQPEQGAVQLRAVKVTASDYRSSTTEGTGSYTTRAMGTATGLALTPRETPQSVSVISRQQIEDRNFVTLDDAMEVATGITASTANFNRISYTARGFALTDNMIDGMPSVGNAYAGYVPNLAFFDRVEVIRGSAGLTYGGISLSGSAGGAVNLIRKRPTAEPRVSVVLRRGSWDNNYAEIDGSVALNDSGSVRGRAVLAYEERETFIDLEESRKPAFYGIVEADIGERTLVTLGASVERYDGNFASHGLPRYSDGRDLRLSRSSRGMAPAWVDYYTDVDGVFAEVEHRFDERWNLRVAANYQEREQGGLTFNATGAVNPVTSMGPTYGAGVIDSMSPDERQALDLLLSGGFDLFGRSHEIAVGGSWAETESKRGRSATAPAPVITQTIFDFDPWAVARPAFGPWVRSPSSSTSTTSGVFGVTRLSLADSLKLILGGRVSSVESESRNVATGARTSADESEVFTPYGGLVYDFAGNWSAYASYADIFRPQSTLYTANGNPLEPVVGANYELGVKGEFYGGKLNTSFAVFRVEETNRSQVDPDNTTPCQGSPTLGDCYIAEGEVRGEGFEMELAGEILPGWETTAGYTFVETEYLRDRTRTGESSANEGRPFRSTTPKHLFRVWSNYHLPGALSRWSVGGGVNVQSEIYTLASNIRLEQGGYSLWNARLGYQLNDNWNLALNINNLFDKHYYLRLGSLAAGNRYGEPRNTMLTLRGSF